MSKRRRPKEKVVVTREQIDQALSDYKGTTTHLVVTEETPLHINNANPQPVPDHRHILDRKKSL